MQDVAETKILEILTDSHPMLRQRSAEIGEPTDEIRQLAADMLATMYASNGIGLAAIQVGRPVRMLVFDAGKPENRRPVVMIDPEVVWTGKRTIDYEEGCLSIPGLRITVDRPSDVDVAYTDLDGVRQKLGFGGMPSRIVQHEMDHLDGVLMTDRLLKAA